MIAYLRCNLCVWVDDPPPAFLDFDEVMPNAVNAAKGLMWNGSAFVAPTGELANKVALFQQADDALAANLGRIDTLTTWRTSGPGAGSANLTSAQLSAAVRQSADNQIAIFKQLDALIRLARNKLDGTD